MEEQEPKKVNWTEVLGKAGKRALGGGAAGGVAMILNVVSMMWLRTTINYQYKNGTKTMQAFRELYAEGGVRRFYKGLAPALFQGPLARFGDTAANVGVMYLLDQNEKTKKLPVVVKTLAASLSAACWRIFLMPIDTTKTFMQVHGDFPELVKKVKTKGPSVLYHGAIGAATASYAGHFPWFFTNNFLSTRIPTTDDKLLKFVRRAGIGFCSSLVSDTVSNSIRVCKVYKQTSQVDVSYPQAVKEIVASEGLIGLFGRGLKTKIMANGLQGIIFNVLWKYIMDNFNKPKEE